jgi:hypothetical protein
MLEISKEFQETIHVELTIRFCINVKGYEIPGTYNDVVEDNLWLCESIISFDDPKLVYESGTFTPEEVNEIKEWIENNIELPKI